MKIVLATNNQDKVKEIKDFFSNYEIYALNEVMTPFEIAENGKSFQENALIKVRAVYEKLVNLGLESEFIALSDDSGISVEALNFAPGIFSARYSGKNATDASNRAKMIAELNARNLRESRAFYTACIAVASRFGDYSAHGFMHGKVINEERGNNGFGYDFMFIPDGFSRTVGELEFSVKREISHRSRGLNLISPVLRFLERKFTSNRPNF